MNKRLVPKNSVLKNMKIVFAFRTRSSQFCIYMAGFTVILAAQLSVCEFHATRKIRSVVSELFRGYPPGKAPRRGDVML